MKKFCENCGKELKEEFKVCPYCTNKNMKKKMPDYIKVGLIMFVCMCGLVLLAIIFGEPVEENNQMNNNTKTTTTSTTKTLSVEEQNEFENNFKSKCKTYNYKDIFRNAEKYDGEYIKVKGKVVQVLEDTLSYNVRLDMTKDKYGFWDDTIYISLIKSNVDTRILEDDIITVWGTLGGLYSYEAVSGATITLPLIHGFFAEINE